MPSFKTDFDFLICKTQEFFGETETHQAMKRIIISKEFCNILVKHKVINYNTNEIYPMTNWLFRSDCATYFGQMVPLREILQ